jgi:hypothetical protein
MVPRRPNTVAIAVVARRPPPPRALPPPSPSSPPPPPPPEAACRGLAKDEGRCVRPPSMDIWSTCAGGMALSRRRPTPCVPPTDCICSWLKTVAFKIICLSSVEQSSNSNSGQFRWVRLRLDRRNVKG